MSYIENKEGYTFNAGYFLAHEECERKTYEIPASMGVNAGDGAKYVPAGTPFPSDDGNAIGLVYEDTDVSVGNVAGSIVTKGTVYNGRLPITGANYDAVTLKDLVSPKAQGWQERSGTSPNYTYADSTDTTVDTSKTYYLPDESHTAVSDYAAVLNPKTEGWYERSGSSPNYVYTLSTDTEGDSSKTYYEKSDVRVTSTAKSAMTGITFIDEPAVTR